MEIKFNSKSLFFLNIFLIPFLLCYSYFFISTNEVNLYYSMSNIIAIALAMIISLLLNFNKNNFFINMINLFFLTTFFLPMTLGSFDQFFHHRSVNFSTIRISLPIIIYQYLIYVLIFLLINPNLRIKKSKYFNNSYINLLLGYAFIITIISLYENLYNYKIFETFPGYIQILKTIFNVYIALISLFFIYFFKSKQLSNIQLNISIFLFLVLFINSFLSGSRSFIFVILFIYLFFLFITESSLQINYKKILLSIFLIFLALFTFALGSSIRNFSYNENDSFLFILFNHWLLGPDAFFNLFNVSLSRLSYIDFAVEKIANEVIYQDYINLNYYFKAIVDKLTPGYEIFNTPFVTRSVYYARLSLDQHGGIFNSEIIPFFAELHLLFGYYSFFFILLYTFFIKVFFNILSKFKHPLYSFYLIIFSYYFIKISSGGMALDFYFVFFIYLFIALIFLHLISYIYVEKKVIN